MGNMSGGYVNCTLHCHMRLPTYINTRYVQRRQGLRLLRSLMTQGVQGISWAFLLVRPGPMRGPKLKYILTPFVQFQITSSAKGKKEEKSNKKTSDARRLGCWTFVNWQNRCDMLRVHVKEAQNSTSDTKR